MKMRRQKLKRLQELFEDAWCVLDNEWSFGGRKEINDREKAEADAIFAELFQETTFWGKLHKGFYSILNRDK